MGKKYQVQNFGSSGATALNRGNHPYQQTSAYTQALQFKPDILVVILGTNDCKINLDSPTRVQFHSDYATLLAAFKAANPTVKIYPCLPPPFFGAVSGSNGQLTRAVLPLIQAVAGEERYQVIDFNTPLSNRGELFADGIHPNTEGTRLMAAEVYRTLTGSPPPA